MPRFISFLLFLTLLYITTVTAVVPTIATTTTTDDIETQGYFSIFFNYLSSTNENMDQWRGLRGSLDSQHRAVDTIKSKNFARSRELKEVSIFSHPPAVASASMDDGCKYTNCYGEYSCDYLVDHYNDPTTVGWSCYDLVVIYGCDCSGCVKCGTTTMEPSLQPTQQPTRHDWNDSLTGFDI